ncbi:unnamed protein product [Candida verbasci]|uniref:Transcription factor MBP1 n=1 Tax=Candida verbasci TaxID=1227364 RepID=A0A9W4XAS6_9ASCO|nr:unnamed protein product [Candida verbasci]
MSLENNSTIYSATYSNVPVLEFVTSEGPIMRRKNDSWINATHILKIAKFPKARRTRILEKDVQTGIHEKVQGGYGKYQGTYVPLQIGEQIAKNFKVYDILKPIFEYKYIEGESKTPPPAPKHNHASAINIAKRQASFNKKQQKLLAQESFQSSSFSSDEPKKRGRPRRSQTLSGTPSLSRSNTKPIESIDNGETDDDESNTTIIAKKRRYEFGESQQDLLSSKELFGVSRNSIDKKNSVLFQQYRSPSINLNLSQENQIYNDYFQSLLSFFLDDNVRLQNSLPEKLLVPPQPLSKININQSIDNEGNTIFHWACSMANLPIIEFLLKTFKSEISSNIRNNNGETPLMFLVKFNNAYNSKSFYHILSALINSIYKVDSNGKTILHHIIENKKEKISKYYLDCLLVKLIENQEEQVEEGNDQFQIIYKFINHQNSDGNTAFHIASYNLKKKLIRTFINYHKFIDFELRNLVGCTVEDYLASHNFVLKLDNEAKNEPDITMQETEISNNIISFENQLIKTKQAMNLQNSVSNIITEKLSNLAFSLTEELNKKDETISNYYKIIKQISELKISSQRKTLSYFKYENLIDDLEDSNTYSQQTTSSSQEHLDLNIDLKKDFIIQSEINRLINDLTFQLLNKEEELNCLKLKYHNLYNIKHANVINDAAINKQEVEEGDALELAIELQNQIIKRRSLVNEIIESGINVPIANLNIKKESNGHGFIESFSNASNGDDNLFKYIKLISLSCGLKFDEIEKSIDLIEQSLTNEKSKK